MSNRINHIHKIQIQEVESVDGTLPPSFAQIDHARDSNKIGAKPSDEGYKHAIGSPRIITKFRWACSCGAQSGRCLFPDKATAARAGSIHRAQTFTPDTDPDAFTWKPETHAEAAISKKALSKK